jgi:uncharacterized surface protein with fasciclin (FAS1) repeats
MKFVAVALAAVAVAMPLRAQDMKAPAKDIVETAVAAGSFNTLAAALKAAGLVETLKGKGPFTVFAPTDDAFKKLPPGTLEDLLKPENKSKLVAILTYHVVSGKVLAADVKPGKVKTVQGSEATLMVMGKGVMIDKANVVKTDVVASNGVIHVIDAVILPPAKKERHRTHAGRAPRCPGCPPGGVARRAPDTFGRENPLG